MCGSAITGKSLMEDDQQIKIITITSIFLLPELLNSITLLKNLNPHLSTKLVSLHLIILMTTMKKLSHRVVFAVLAENFGGDPALCAWDPRPSTETVTSHC